MKWNKFKFIGIFLNGASTCTICAAGIDGTVVHVTSALGTWSSVALAITGSVAGGAALDLDTTGSWGGGCGRVGGCWRPVDWWKWDPGKTENSWKQKINEGIGTTTLKRF